MRVLHRRQPFRPSTAARGCIAANLAIALLLATTACGRKHNHIANVPRAPRPVRSTSTPQPNNAPPPNNTPRPNNAPPPPAVATGYTEVGLASWYGIPYHGRRAADGEIYDMETLVAAHRVLPFNTWLRVTNVVNDKSVTVRVIDRGPFVEGRIIDLSKAAARRIELLGPGVGQVRVEVISAPADIPSNDYYAVQVGAFSMQDNAERARERFAERFGAAQLALKQGRQPLWRVLVGKLPSIAAAQELARILSVEQKNVFIVRLDQTNTVPGQAPTTPGNSNAATAPHAQ